MTMEIFKKYIGLLLSIIVAIILVVVVYNFQLANKDMTDSNMIYLVLSDAFFVPGILYTSLGILILISKFEGFDGLAFIGYSVGTIFTPSKHRFEERMNYLEYKKQRKEKLEKKSPSSILIVGILMIIIALVFTLMFKG